MWLPIVAVILLIAAIFWVAEPRYPVDPDHEKVVQEAPRPPRPRVLSKAPKKSYHDLCCDSLCPSLSQYYNPLTKTCMERPMMPYGYGLGGGPCLVDFQDCSANPPAVPGPDLGLPREKGKTCGTLCDRFGGSLYYTGFTGVAAMKPAMIPSNRDGLGSFMGAKHA